LSGFNLKIQKWLSAGQQAKVFTVLDSKTRAWIINEEISKRSSKRALIL
jgi:hypothetical protein